LWKTTDGQTKVLFVWAIELSGLLYIPPMLLQPKMFHPNSLVFCMTGGNYTAPHCIKEDQPTLARITDLTLLAKDVRISGTLSQLTRYLFNLNSIKLQLKYYYYFCYRIHNIQRITNKQRGAAILLKDKVIQGEIGWNGDFMKKHQSATLRRLMSKEESHKPSRQIILSKRKEIELVKFRVLLLNQEKFRKIALLRHKTQTNKTLYSENSIKSKFHYYIFLNNCFIYSYLLFSRAFDIRLPRYYLGK